MASKDAERKKELAYTLFMSGQNQQEIGEKVGVSRITVNKWVNTLGWKERRAAKQVTRGELSNKVLLSLDKMLEKALNSDNVEDLSGLPDKLAKIAKTIESLDKKANVVSTIEICMLFGNWLEQRIGSNKTITLGFVKEVTKLQDAFINEQFNIHKK